MNTSAVIINNIKLPVNASSKEAFSVARSKLAKLGVALSGVSFSIYRRSVDARHKDSILFVYSVLADGVCGVSEDVLARHGMSLLVRESPKVEIGSVPLDAPPVVVGSGPCGLFATLLLAENGYNPILLERGGDVAQRQHAVEALKKFRILDSDTNIQFGAGGAGTFSDGKLVTRINDPMSAYVIERFIEFGAPEEIAYIAKPHIGTDILSRVVENLILRIRQLGGTVLFNTRFEGFETHADNIVSVKTSRGDMQAGALVLAIGHSARDTYEYLFSRGVTVEAKPFSVGMRIEHLADDIDKSLYGKMAGNPKLGRAEYNLSYDTKNRGVYTFCMCPGGVVVPATSEENGVVVNGMSYSGRDNVNSNSAVVCSIFKEDYGATPQAAIEFQRKIERAAFVAGGSDYSAPMITVGDFFDGVAKTVPERIIPSYMDGVGTKIAQPGDYLPTHVTSQIKNAIGYFDKKISGFAVRDAVLTGPETRTSAPVRITRNPETRLAIGYNNFYPAGEGAGYAGGITSAAIDGIRSAMALIKEFAPYHG